jgi:hypothetical protein
MNLRYLTYFLAIWLSGLSIMTLAASASASNQDAVFGRWYPTTFGPASFLDISEDKIVFDNEVAYQTTVVGDFGRGGVLFKVIGTKRNATEGYGCFGGTTYIIAEPLPTRGRRVSQITGGTMRIFFYFGDKEPPAVPSIDAFDYIGLCSGLPFARRQVAR